MANVKMLPSQGPANPKVMAGDAQRGKRSIWLVASLLNITDRMMIGFPIALLIVSFVISLKWGLLLLSVGFLSYVIQGFLNSFDQFIHRNDWEREKAAMNEPEIDIDSMPTMDRTMLRLRHFKDKYGYDLDGLIYITTQDTSLRMDIRDNLDYVEIVGLLNQLCLEMGDHFASEEEGKQQ